MPPAQPAASPVGDDDINNWMAQRWRDVRALGSRVTDDGSIDWLLPAKAIPLFWDGCGNLWGADVSTAADHPAVYFFDKADAWEKPAYAAGSSIGTFLLLLAEHDTAVREKRGHGWELKIDPDLGKCPRAPPIWLAD